MAELSNAFQAEIQALEAKLEAKKKEMAASGTEQAEKQIFKTVVREHTGHETPSASLNQAGAAPQPGVSASAAALSPADEQKIDDLVSHAFTKGIISAVGEAKKTGIPFLVDMLHDRLADEYYQKLLDARKLNAD
jgi:hypothetical protein